MKNISNKPLANAKALSSVPATLRLANRAEKQKTKPAMFKTRGEPHFSWLWKLLALPTELFSFKQSNIVFLSSSFNQ